MQATHPHDTLPRPELERLQLERLRSTIRRVTESVPFYREKLHAAGIAADDIRSLADVRRLPFTTKQDLRDHYPFGLFAVPLADVARIHASSGTTGKMTVVGYTLRDIDTWAEICSRSLQCAGVQRGDIVHNAYGYGLFTGGLGVHYGAEKLGDDGHPDLRRQHQTPDHDPPGLRRDGAHLHALLRAEHGRDDARTRRRPGLAEAARRHLRRRALVGGDARRDREAAQPGRAGHLRPLRGHGARRGHGVPGEEGPARLRGPLHRRGRRPGLRRAAGPGGARGTGLHLAHQGGVPGHPLPHARHHRAGHRPVQLRAHAGAHGARHRPHRRHADHPRRERLPLADREHPRRPARASSRTTSSSSTASARWTPSRCRSR